MAALRGPGPLPPAVAGNADQAQADQDDAGRLGDGGDEGVGRELEVRAVDAVDRTEVRVDVSPSSAQALEQPRRVDDPEGRDVARGELQADDGRGRGDEPARIGAGDVEVDGGRTVAHHGLLAAVIVGAEL